MPHPFALTDEAADTLRPALKLERFFPRGLDAETVHKFFPRSGLYLYDADEFVISQGEESKDLFVVNAGSVTVTKTMGTAGVHLATMGPGSLFGEIALIRDGVRVANVVAAETATIFRIAVADVLNLVRQHPELGRHLQELARERAGG